MRITVIGSGYVGLVTGACLSDLGFNEIACDADYAKGQEMGWFEHGSTILVLVPPGFEWAEGVDTSARIRMGQALMKRLM